MPGPDGPWGDALVAAVRAGDIDEADVDRKVLRLLRLAAARRRARRVHGAGRARSGSRTASRSPARRRSTAPCCCENRGELPLGRRGARARSPSSATTPAPPAPRAAAAPPSCPSTPSSPLDGLRAALPGADVTLRPRGGRPGRRRRAPAARADQPGHRRARACAPVPRRRRHGAVRRGPPLDRPRLLRRRRPDRGGRRASSCTTRYDAGGHRRRSGSASPASAPRGSSSTASCCVDDQLAPSGTDLGAAFLNPPSRVGRGARSPPARRSTCGSSTTCAGRTGFGARAMSLRLGTRAGRRPTPTG